MQFSTSCSTQPGCKFTNALIWKHALEIRYDEAQRSTACRAGEKIQIACQSACGLSASRNKRSVFIPTDRACSVRKKGVRIFELQGLQAAWQRMAALSRLAQQSMVRAPQEHQSLCLALALASTVRACRAANEAKPGTADRRSIAILSLLTSPHDPEHTWAAALVKLLGPQLQGHGATRVYLC